MTNLSPILKRLWPCVLLFIALAAVPVWAQNPFKFNYQGVARDGNGKLVSAGPVSVRVRIREASPAGAVVYEQTDAAQTNAAGVFNITVGNNTFLGIDWGSKEYYMQTELDADGGADAFTDMGTTQLLSVPYALISKQWVNNYPVIQKGAIGTGSTLPAVQAGANLIWYPRKGAFRAGSVDVNGAAYWNEASIGLNTFATGYNVKASGDGSIAMGRFNFASGVNAVAIGSNLFANSKDGVTIGRGAISDGEGGVAVGHNVKAAGEKSLAMGSEGAMATGYEAVSIGVGTVARAFGSVTLGTYNNAQDPIGLNASYDGGSRLFQIGNGINDNSRSNALTVLRNGNIGIGSNVLNPKNILEVGGRMRLRYEGGLTAGVWLSDNGDGKEDIFIGRNDNYGGAAGFYSQLHKKWDFVVNGSGNATLFGAMHIEDEVYVGGDGIFQQNLKVKGTVKQSSDRRLKKDITRLTGSLAQLTRLNGYHYHWKSADRSRELQTGVIAQEVEALFPELVSTDADGLKSVNYTGLIPHLIEAVKELNEKSQALARLETEVAEMKRLVAGLRKDGNQAASEPAR